MLALELPLGVRVGARICRDPLELMAADPDAVRTASGGRYPPPPPPPAPPSDP
ncbi:hypothetical protein L2K70_10915 [Nocardioides KLBMP 9356]|uniref:Uncharacterized protein n=1 Tax=Nocardioides potassii TaxID=2911371 RepID=A0ABS9HDF9_9ACTN|nr:hypothetical protein [Nocardioides potassii]MCF6378113.1 hypothetical protein [Nocardioides potassii]